MVSGLDNGFFCKFKPGYALTVQPRSGCKSSALAGTLGPECQVCLHEWGGMGSQFTLNLNPTPYTLNPKP